MVIPAGPGGRPATVTLVFTLTVPANALSGNYSSTWTFSIATGPSPRSTYCSHPKLARRVRGVEETREEIEEPAP